MPVDKKRKASEKSKAVAAPAKKRKVEPPKGKAATKTQVKGKAATRRVTSTKVKKPEAKKIAAKVTKISAKVATKATPAKKTPVKTTKTPAKPTKEVRKPAPAKKEPPKKATAQKPPAKAAATVTRAKLDKAKAVTVKAKLKSTKTPPKGKIEKKKAAVKKREPKDESEEEEEETKTPAADKKSKAAPTKGVKRKADTPAGDSDSGAKKRAIIPNKRQSGFEVEGRSKRTITPNKKYADFETENMPKPGKVSELRAFIQEKKSGKPEKEATPKAEKKKTVTKSPVKKTPAKEKSPKGDEDDEEKIKIFKPSEMKPAEKLLKKLQKKLEKEAKGTPAPITTAENREKAKIKITKVVDYKKPLSSDDVEMKKLAKKIEANKPKPSPATAKAKLLTPKAPKPTETKVVKPKAIPNQVKAPKATQKQTVEKIVKPKKIKDLKREERPIQAKFLCQKSVQLADDNQNVQCWITGIGVFPSGEIIMVDMSNRRIKLFSKDFEFLSKVKLDAIPQDISVSPVNASFAYFTKPFSKEGIQKVMMSDGKLTLKEFFVTNGTNRGITCTKAGILTSVQDGRYHDVDINHFKIYLLDYNGNILQSVSTDQTGTRLFKLPLYFTVSSNGKQMIVADCIKQNSYILNVDMDGKIKFKYEGMNNNPITPRGLTIDDNDNIYVTEWERNNIYILSPAGKRLQMLFSHSEVQLDKIDGLLKPYQLCYYKAENQKRLIVSQESCNKIKVFKLLSKEEMEAETAAEAEKKKAEEEAKAKGKVDATPAKPEAEVKTQASTSSASSEVTEPQKPAEAPKPEAIVVPPPTPEVITLATTASEPKKILVATASTGTEPKKVIVAATSKGTEPKKVIVTTPSAVGQETKRVIVNTPDAKKIIIAPPSAVGSDATKAVLNPVTGAAVEAKKIIVSPNVGTNVMKLVTVSPPPAKTTSQVVAQSITPKPTTIVVTKPAEPKPVKVSDKKEYIFADTVIEFDDDADAETEVNGKLQDIVIGFPNESEPAPLQTTNVAAPMLLIPEMRTQVAVKPAPVDEDSSAPILTLESPSEVIPHDPDSDNIENMVAEACRTPQITETVTSGTVQQSVDVASDVSNTIIETVVVSDNAFADLNTITYSSVPQGEMVAVSEPEVIDPTEAEDPNIDPSTITQVTNETLYVSEYHTVPVELETITTEYVV